MDGAQCKPRARRPPGALVESQESGSPLDCGLRKAEVRGGGHCPEAAGRHLQGTGTGDQLHTRQGAGGPGTRALSRGPEVGSMGEDLGGDILHLPGGSPGRGTGPNGLDPLSSLGLREEVKTTSQREVRDTG